MWNNNKRTRKKNWTDLLEKKNPSYFWQAFTDPSRPRLKYFPWFLSCWVRSLFLPRNWKNSKVYFFLICFIEVIFVFPNIALATSVIWAAPTNAIFEHVSHTGSRFVTRQQERENCGWHFGLITTCFCGDVQLLLKHGGKQALLSSFLSEKSWDSSSLFFNCTFRGFLSNEIL